jgi:hypothetical protein
MQVGSQRTRLPVNVSTYPYEVKLTVHNVSSVRLPTEAKILDLSKFVFFVNGQGWFLREVRSLCADLESFTLRNLPIVL